MKFRIYTIIIFILSSTWILPAQELNIFQLTQYETSTKDTIAFISLSDVYILSEHPDSLATPDLSDKPEEEAPQNECFILTGEYRTRFLKGTGLNESDEVFYYSYLKNIFISYPVNKLKVIACLNIYGGTWPYTQYDYMIGFQVDRKLLTGFEPYYTNTLVYAGKKSPFVMNQLKPVAWRAINADDVNFKMIQSYDTSYAGICKPGNAYIFDTKEFQYYVQDLIRLDDYFVAAKKLWVTDLKTKKVFEKIYYSGESASFADAENQWTGNLFKNKPHVIFGFQWFSFGCPQITFLDADEKEIYINCDNRH